MSNSTKLTICPVAFRVPVGDRLAVVHLDTHGHLIERKEEGEFVEAKTIESNIFRLFDKKWGKDFISEYFQNTENAKCEKNFWHDADLFGRQESSFQTDELRQHFQVPFFHLFCYGLRSDDPLCKLLQSLNSLLRLHSKFFCKITIQKLLVLTKKQKCIDATLNGSLLIENCKTWSTRRSFASTCSRFSARPLARSCKQVPERGRQNCPVEKQTTFSNCTAKIFNF